MNNVAGNQLRNLPDLYDPCQGHLKASVEDIKLKVIDSDLSVFNLALHAIRQPEDQGIDHRGTPNPEQFMKEMGGPVY